VISFPAIRIFKFGISNNLVIVVPYSVVTKYFKSEISKVSDQLIIISVLSTVSLKEQHN
jgi:hypothetical protein